MLKDMNDDQIDEYIADLCKKVLKKHPELETTTIEEPGSLCVIWEEGITEMCDDAGGGPRGGWFPDIVNGPTKEAVTATEKLAKKFDISEDFFEDMDDIDDCWEDDDFVDAFENWDDEENADTMRKLAKEISKEDCPLSSIYEFYFALTNSDMEEDREYYLWDGEWIDLYDNVCECGERRGSYTGWSDAQWIEELERLLVEEY